MTRGCYPWEHDGYPFGSVLRHARTWWDYHHLPNILLVHFADLLVDLEGETRRIASFLEIRPLAEAWPRIVRNCTFAEMKKHGEELVPQTKMILRGGSDSFFHKGTNGRWRDVLAADELRLYDAAADRELTPECRRWLERRSFRSRQGKQAWTLRKRGGAATQSVRTRRTRRWESCATVALDFCRPSGSY
jgi:aryl sulfotransferase